MNVAVCKTPITISAIARLGSRSRCHSTPERVRASQLRRTRASELAHKAASPVDPPTALWLVSARQGRRAPREEDECDHTALTTEELSQSVNGSPRRGAG